MRLAAQEMDVTRFLPAQIVVGKHLLGPADFLFAALDVLCGSDWVTLSPRSQQPCLDDYPKLRDSDMRGWIHDEKFKDQYLSDRLRWQAWTFRR
jgi:hypothetical protein